MMNDWCWYFRVDEGRPRLVRARAELGAEQSTIADQAAAVPDHDADRARAAPDDDAGTRGGRG
jgi:hypothetical protein